jgi:Spy/CpxP family protein refolding chaperone
MHGGAMRDRGHDAATYQESTGHYLRHLLKHPKEIGLSADQVARLKTIQLDLNRTRIKTEADIQVAELELASLTEDEKADLAAIEAKVKQSEMLEAGLRVAAIKAKRDALALLTPEQREKEKAEHEKMMQQRAGDHGGGMMGGMGGGMMGGGHGGPPQAAPKKEEHGH